MRFRTFLTYLSLLPLGACTKSCDYDNNEEFAKAKLPAYTETGANTLGCVLGQQVWTVLGSHSQPSPLGSGRVPNTLEISGEYLVPPQLLVRGRMTGARNSKEFYDTEIQLYFNPSDTLGGLRLLGDDTAPYPRRAEYMEASSFVGGGYFSSSNRHPVRLLIRKLNRQRRIVSGTFSGMLYQDHGPDSLAVTDGRFDLKY